MPCFYSFIPWQYHTCYKKKATKIKYKKNYPKHGLSSLASRVVKINQARQTTTRRKLLKYMEDHSTKHRLVAIVYRPASPSLILYFTTLTSLHLTTSLSHFLSPTLISSQPLHSFFFTLNW